MNKKIYEVWEGNPQLSNAEKTEALNKEFGLKWTIRSYQQRHKNYKSGLEDGEKKGVSDARLNVIAKAKIRLEEERQLIAAQRTYIRKSIKKKVIADHIKQRVTEVISPKIRDYVKVDGIKESEIAYIGVSDEQFRGAGDIDALRDIFKSMGNYIKTQHANKKHIVILNGGDNIEGSHRPSANVAISNWATDQAILFANELNDFLLSLSKDYKVTYYMVTLDNHGEYRSVGGPGESPRDNALNFIAEIIKGQARHNPNLDVHAKQVFYEEKLPGGINISMCHGNTMIQKKDKSFKSFMGQSKILLRGHKHHYEFMQHVGWDSLGFPAAKNHIEDYEIGGGWAEIEPKTGKAFRIGQFIDIRFNKKLQRVQGVDLIEVTKGGK